MASRKDILLINGKTIAGVIVKRGGPNPGSEVFLIFTDNSVLELYTANDEIIPSFRLGGAEPAVDWVRPYCSDVMEITIDHVDESLLNQKRTE